MNKREIININWNTVEYNAAWHRQETIFTDTVARKLRGEQTENRLIFCEHPHVYTLGKSGDDSNLLIDLIALQAKNAAFVRTDRGGDITYHGYGQLVGYPIFDLENFGIGLKQFVFNIEEAIIRSLVPYNITASRLAGATGVWLDADKPTARKICAIGIRSSRYVTMHGFALNANTDLRYFDYINPCGFTDKGVTSIEKETGKKVDIEELKETVAGNFKQIF